MTATGRSVLLSYRRQSLAFDLKLVHLMLAPASGETNCRKPSLSVLRLPDAPMILRPAMLVFLSRTREQTLHRAAFYLTGVLIIRGALQEPLALATFTRTFRFEIVATPVQIRPSNVRLLVSVLELRKANLKMLNCAAPATHDGVWLVLLVLAPIVRLHERQMIFELTPVTLKSHACGRLVIGRRSDNRMLANVGNGVLLPQVLQN